MLAGRQHTNSPQVHAYQAQAQGLAPSPSSTALSYMRRIKDRPKRELSNISPSHRSEMDRGEGPMDWCGCTCESKISARVGFASHMVYDTSGRRCQTIAHPCRNDTIQRCRLLQSSSNALLECRRIAWLVGPCSKTLSQCLCRCQRHICMRLITLRLSGRKRVYGITLRVRAFHDGQVNRVTL
jgi:hypothetical protein